MALEHSPKGYDYDFVNTVHERFICTICTKVMKDPYLMVCCGQKYCHPCLQKWLEGKDTKTCPHCRASSKSNCEFQYVVERGMKSEIESFHILCSNHKQGCEWVGEMQSLDNHLKSDEGCDFSLVDCPNKCSPPRRLQGKNYTKVLRKNLSDHLQNHCSLRRIECEYCSQESTAGAYPSHLTRCDMFPMQCPNECGEEGIVRKSVKSHRQTCRLEVVPCEYVSVGCDSHIARQNMEQHMESNQRNHLDMITKAHKKLVQETKKKEKVHEKLVQETKEKEKVHEKLVKDTKMKEKVVLCELDIAAKQNCSCHNKDWLSSLKSQFARSITLNYRTEKVFRMTDYNEIKSGTKDWFSPYFQVDNGVMQLHVKCHALSTNKLDLELLLVSMSTSSCSLFSSTKIIAVELQRTYRDRRKYQQAPKWLGKDTLNHDLSNLRDTTKETLPFVLVSWSLENLSVLESHYNELDSLLWTIHLHYF